MNDLLDEGYIKFKTNWEKTPPLPFFEIKKLNDARQTMYEMGLIGAYADGIGFGNISQRILDTNQFIISGSATGNFKALTNLHYSTVAKVEIEKNELTCKGPIIASSESMSHAVIYEALQDVNAVIHIHHLEWWQKLMFKIPTTKEGATYGTPDMAYSILDLIEHSDLKTKKIFVMQSHKEGIFAFGGSLMEAINVIRKTAASFK